MPITMDKNALLAALRPTEIGSVIPWPLSQRTIDQGRLDNSKGFGQRGLRWNPITQQYEDLKADVIPLPIMPKDNK